MLLGLSVFDKLLDKLMYNRLDSFLHKYKIFYNYQFGFRKNRATTNALTEVIDYIYKSLDEGNYVFGIFLDLKKHSILYSIIYSEASSNITEYVELPSNGSDHT